MRYVSSLGEITMEWDQEDTKKPTENIKPLPAQSNMDRKRKRGDRPLILPSVVSRPSACWRLADILDGWRII